MVKVTILDVVGAFESDKRPWMEAYPDRTFVEVELSVDVNGKTETRKEIFSDVVWEVHCAKGYYHEFVKTNTGGN